jgi:hypothetical protein
LSSAIFFLARCTLSTKIILGTANVLCIKKEITVKRRELRTVENATTLVEGFYNFQKLDWSFNHKKEVLNKAIYQGNIEGLPTVFDDFSCSNVVPIYKHYGRHALLKPSRETYESLSETHCTETMYRDLELHIFTWYFREKMNLSAQCAQLKAIEHIANLEIGMSSRLIISLEEVEKAIKHPSQGDFMSGGMTAKRYLESLLLSGCQVYRFMIIPLMAKVNVESGIIETRIADRASLLLASITPAKTRAVYRLNDASEWGVAQYPCSQSTGSYLKKAIFKELKQINFSSPRELVHRLIRIRVKTSEFGVIVTAEPGASQSNDFIWDVYVFEI